MVIKETSVLQCIRTGVADGASWTAEGCGASVVVGIGAFSVSLKAVSFFLLHILKQVAV